ncbi:hypothetical protein D3C76_1450220 [compost metagenome]
MPDWGKFLQIYTGGNHGNSVAHTVHPKHLLHLFCGSDHRVSRIAKVAAHFPGKSFGGGIESADFCDVVGVMLINGVHGMDGWDTQLIGY